MNHNISRYLSKVPIALGIERLTEAHQYKFQEIERPILDLGCGDGLFVKFALGEKIEFGLDPNRREIRAAEKIRAYEVLLQEYGNKISLRDGQIKSVISNSVLEHIKNLEEVFKEVYRILNTGGSFIFTVPSSNFEKSSAGAHIFRALKLKKLEQRWCTFYNVFWRHYHAYSLEEWQHFIESHGFKVKLSYEFNSRQACLTNDLLASLGILGKISKITFNRWTFLGKVREVIFRYLEIYIKQIAQKRSTPLESGGLVFIHAIKI